MKKWDGVIASESNKGKVLKYKIIQARNKRVLELLISAIDDICNGKRSRVDYTFDKKLKHTVDMPVVNGRTFKDVQTAVVWFQYAAEALEIDLASHPKMKDRYGSQIFVLL